MDSYSAWGMGSAAHTNDGNPIPSSTSSDIITAATAATTALSSMDASQILNSSTFVTSALSTIGDAQFFEESISPSTVRSQLSVAGDPSNASTTINLLKGMKWLLANMSKGRNVSDFFSHVVKLVGVPNMEVRKMVYIYLARYANHDASCREMALLSINAFQRGLADREPLMRSMALRVLTCMDVPDVLQLQILGVQTCCKDSSPYVRKCAANALGKLHPRCCEVGDLVQAEQLVGIVTKLLEEDGSTMVLTSAMIAFCEICPQRLDLLHGCFRKVCHLLTDMDEWGQTVVLDALTRYCRTYFKQPRGQKKGAAERIDQEKRVTRSTRKKGLGGSSAVDDGEGMGAGSRSVVDGTDALLSLTGETSSATAANTNGSTSHNMLPPHPKNKSKRRVVRKAFYSDEEDESSDEEVGNIAGSLRDNSLLGIGSGGGGTKSFGFRDDVNAVEEAKSNGVSSAMGGMSDADMNDEEDSDLDEDHKLLLQSSISLLKSRNSAVVMAVCSLHYYCGIASIKTRSAMGKALVRIHRDRREIQYVVLVSIRTLVKECPSAFTPFLNDFFVKGMDPSFTRMIKLDILVSLCIDPTAIDAVLTELRTYVRHNDKTFACAAIHAVGKITELARVVYDRRAHTAGLDAASARENANVIALNCLSGLVTLSEYSKNEKVVGECAETMQRILAQLWSCNGCVSSKHSNGMGLPATNDPARVQESALKRLLLILVRAISRVEVNGDEEGTEQNQLEMRAVCVPDSAVSSILWVIGEWFIMSETMSSPWSLDKSKKANIRLEILRLLAKSFSEVNPQMKLQAVHLASKVLFMLKANQQLSVDTTIQECAICEFILAMGRVDVLQDIRDRSRYESNVLHMSIGLSHDTSALQSLPGNAVSISVENAKSMLLHGKPTASSLPLDGKEFGSVKNETDLFRFGTLSSIVGHRTGGSNMSLPKWADADSPSSLRDPMAPKPDEIIGEGGLDSGGLYSSSSEEDSSSDDDSSSSSSESSSDDSDDSDDDSSDSESDDSSDDDDDNEKLDAGNNGVFGSNALGVKPLIPIPTQEPEALLPSLMNDIARDSSSSSDDDSDSDDSDESSDDKDANIHALVKPSVGTLFDMEAAANPSQFPMQYSKQTSNTSSTVAAGLEDLVMTPLVMDKQDTAQPSNIDNESGLWKDFVRPELGGGLFVKARFLHGRSRAREAKVIGLDPTNPSTVCLQVHIENMRTDAGTLRHVRIIHRGGTGSGVIAPSKVITPPEIPALKKGKISTVFIGLTFSSATDRDGIALAKFDIKSDRGTTPVEIRPSLGELLDSPKSVSISEFDTAFAELQGIHQRISASFSLSYMNDENFGKIPITILQHLNLKQVGKWSGKGCFVGTLPASGQHVYVVVKCDSTTGNGDIVVCGENAMASNSILGLIKQALSTII